MYDFSLLEIPNTVYHMNTLWKVYDLNLVYVEYLDGWEVLRSFPCFGFETPSLPTSVDTI